MPPPPSSDDARTHDMMMMSFSRPYQDGATGEHNWAVYHFAERIVAETIEPFLANIRVQHASYSLLISRAHLEPIHRVDLDSQLRRTDSIGIRELSLNFLLLSFVGGDHPHSAVPAARRR